MSTNSPFILRPVVEQRVDDQCRSIRKVEGAASLNHILKNRFADKTAYVYRVSDRASPSRHDMRVSQRVSQTYAVVLVIKNVRDERGGDASDEAERIAEHEIRPAMLGWCPADGYHQFTYSGSRVLFREGFLLWLAQYTVDTHWSAPCAAPE